MNFSVTVPQLFYDLIARILPGFLFLVLFQGIFSPLGLALPLDLGDSGNNVVGSLLAGIGYSGICYFLGWLFTAFTFGSKNRTVREKHEQKLEEQNPSMSEMYHEIRLLNSGEGFRIIKLRAEARMLEAARTGMMVLIILTILAYAIDLFGWSQFENVTPVGFGISLLIPTGFGVAFRVKEEDAWNNYYGNIPKTHQLIRKHISEFGQKQDDK